MKIEKIKIENYKCFNKTDWIEFDPIFNVIVGKNNSGKTSLIELFSFKFNSIPFMGNEINESPISRIYCSYSVSKSEIIAFFNKNGYSHYFPTKKSIPASINLGTLNTIFSKEKIGFTFNYSPDQSIQDTHITDIGKKTEAIFDEYTYTENKNENENDIIFELKSQSTTISKGNEISYKLSKLLITEISLFRAERFHVGQHKVGSNHKLDDDARNLPEVLLKLISGGSGKFIPLLEHMKLIFPEINEIYVDIIDGEGPLGKIYIKPIKNSVEVSVPLQDSGTGLGQVLALLYAIVTAKKQKIFVIDEPQTFLHPDAIRSFFGILKKYYSHHQYFISTHSPTVINAINPNFVFSLSKQNNESIITRNSMNDINELKSTLLNIGASFSDVFGIDSIIWVEGPTEEKCFPLIVRKLCREELLSTKFFEVKNTDDFFKKDAKKIKLIHHIYKKFSKDIFLLPSKIKFVFDRDKLKEEDIKEFNRYPRKIFSFLDKKMYENYLLIPEAIEYLIQYIQTDSPNKINVSLSEINSWFELNLKKADYHVTKIEKKSREELISIINGANFLDDLVKQLLGSGYNYDEFKPKYGKILTKWVLDNQPESLREIANLLDSIFPN